MEGKGKRAVLWSNEKEAKAGLELTVVEDCPILEVWRKDPGRDRKDGKGNENGKKGHYF